VEVILMTVGGVGLVRSAIGFGVSSRRPAVSRRHTYDHEATVAQGASTKVHDEVQS